MKKDKQIKINRNKYNEIRKMDHNSMEEYINEVYEKGLAAGLKIGEAAAGSFDMNICLAAVSKIKGIGQVKIDQIRLAMIAAGAKE